MALIAIQNVGKHFGERTLFEGVSFEVNAHDKWGLVGANGCGKTTLLRMLTGSLEPDEGQIVYAREAVPGYMEQHVGLRSTRTLWEETERVFLPLMEQEEALQALTVQLESGDSAVIARHHALREQFEAAGGLYYRSRVRSALLGLGFTETDFSLPLTALSGGQRSKAAMARLLLSGANVLLLDEPTNHLDIAATEWLEEFLRGYEGAVIVISHDRYFLDRVTGKTLEIAGGMPYITAGSYSVHADKRKKDKEVAAHHYKTALREVRHLESSIETLHSFNREKSVRAAESKEKLLEKKKAALVSPEAEAEAIRFDFSVEQTGGNEVLTAGELAMQFGDTPLFTDAALSLHRGERVFLLGPNGCGKTTLLKILRGDLTPTAGFVRPGARITVGYYDQTQAGLHEEKTVLREAWDDYPRLTQTQIRSALAAFLFRGDDVFAPVSTLSGGERARLLLLKLMLSGANFLLLDEPTNHLDITSREALEAALESYNGTALIVSHDRYFINRLASRVVRLTAAGCTVFDGDYDAYAATLKQEAAPVAAETAKDNDYRRRKERESARRKLHTRLTKAEEAVTAGEAALAALRATLEDPAVAADYEQVAALSEQIARQERELDEAMSQWESLQLEWEAGE